LIVLARRSGRNKNRAAPKLLFSSRLQFRKPVFLPDKFNVSLKCAMLRIAANDTGTIHFFIR